MALRITDDLTGALLGTVPDVTLPATFQMFVTNADAPYGGPVGSPFTVSQPSGPQPPALFLPTSAAQLQAAWQDAITNGYILQLDPKTKISDSQPISLTGVDFGQQPRGLNGNGACFVYTGDGPAVTIKSGASNSNRGMVLTALHLVGDYSKTTSTGLYVNCDAGASIYKFLGRDIYIDGFGVGMRTEANFFESLLDNLQIENCKGDCVQVADGPGQAIDGIISNITIQTPNCSRSGGYGIHCSTAKSVDVRGGSFINDVQGGILGEQGIRLIDGPNFENCGTAAITLLQAADAGVSVVNCSGSNTATYAGGPMTKLIVYSGVAGGLNQSGNQMYAGTVT
jgi:hypothetical protein